MLAGARPRGNGDLKALRVMLWRLIRLCEEGAWHSHAEGDEDKLLKYANTASNLSARFRDCFFDSDMSERLDELQKQNGNEPKRMAFTRMKRQ